MKLESIRALIEAASPGPWRMHQDAIHVLTAPEGTIADLGNQLRDAEFVIAARTLMPKILAVAEAAKAHRDKTIDDECLPIPTKTGTALDAALASLESE